jgi:ricin-type beta-trefoil lectin protein
MGSAGGSGGDPNDDAGLEAGGQGPGDARDEPEASQPDGSPADAREAGPLEAAADASDVVSQDQAGISTDAPAPPDQASVDVQDSAFTDRNETGSSDADALPPLDVAPEASAEAGPPTGVVYTLVAKHSGKCADVYHNDTVEGTALTQYTCNGTSAQTFELRTANGSYTFVGTNSGKCLGASNGGTANGTPIVINTCNGSTAQAFTLSASGTGHYAIVNVASGKCIDVTGASTASGAVLQLLGCNGQDNQAWAFQ